MSVKLSYFDIRGYAETIRWILHYAGVQFEDIRVPYTVGAASNPLPPEIKAKGNWGQVPLAEDNGKVLAQSGAIARYFAKKHKLQPEDLYQQALCDEYVDAIKDFVTGLFPLYRIQDAKEKEEKLKEFLDVNKPKYLDVFESIIKANGGKSLVGPSITWADISLAQTLDTIQISLGVDFTKDLPNLRNVKDAVLNSPNIKAWRERRPQTLF